MKILKWLWIAIGFIAYFYPISMTILFLADGHRVIGIYDENATSVIIGACLLGILSFILILYIGWKVLTYLDNED